MNRNRIAVPMIAVMGFVSLALMGGCKKEDPPPCGDVWTQAGYTKEQADSARAETQARLNREAAQGKNGGR